MGCTCVVGLQWGDEAKGKIVDLLSDRHDFVVRYNGGANAGHTIVRGGQTFKLSLLPTGVLEPRLRSVIGNGVVVYPPRFREEVEQLRAAGVAVGDNLVVSAHAHVIMPYHLEEERLSEQPPSPPAPLPQSRERGDFSIGTTGRGIGPCYMDKVGRTCGIRVGDLLDAATLRERLRFIVPRKNRILASYLAPGESPGAKCFDAGEICDEYLAHGEYLRRYVADSTHLLHRALRDGKHILFEAAQGSLLDVDFGTYPYVTSSNSTPAGVWSGSGVPARRLDRIIGVIKAYTTRVGKGPFPTELDDGPTGIGERIRKIGREYGTVTGRPRRVGWFDAVAVRYSATLGGVDELALMLLDVLSGLPEVSICTAYEDANGKRIDDFPADAVKLARCRPVLETMPGWSGDLTVVRRRADLPTTARKYIDRIEQLIDLPVRTISVGPDREQTITQ
jgi:adenylosuccinate synthase